MARISRNFEPASDKEFYDAQRDMAARAFLNDNPEIANRINSNESDLYTAVAIHLSLDSNAQNRNEMVAALRSSLETIQQHTPDPVWGSFQDRSAAPEEPQPPTQFDRAPDEVLTSENLPAENGSQVATNNADIFSQPYYQQRGLQAYDDLMEPIVRLAEEALKAVVKAEDTANNPNATDAQITASFKAVDGYQQAISRSLEALPQKLTSRLQNQFDHENIKVPDSSVERFTSHVINNVKLPKTIENFDNASQRIERNEREYVSERRENGPRIIEHQQKMDEQRDIYDNSPRP